MKLAELVHLDADRDRTLLAHAAQIRRQLPEPTPGSRIALAFGEDRAAFAASLLAVWSRGHGAAIAENTLRERILPVLEHEAVVLLLHDTDSGRTLQVPRLLAAAEKDVEAAPIAPETIELASDCLLSVHVQTEDGRQQWCSWNAGELADAIDAVAATMGSNNAPPAGTATPGLLQELFADTLRTLRHGPPAAEANAMREPGEVHIPGAIPTTTPYLAEIDALLRLPGVEDATIVCTPDSQKLTALVGRAAAQHASQREQTLALDAIPRDPNRQPQVAELFLAFGLGRRGQPVRRKLDWQALPGDQTESILRATVPTDYLFYEGHFANYPVLAGGVQLHELILPCLRALHGPLPDLEQLDSIKFLARIAPGDTIEVALRCSEDRRKVSFEVRKPVEPDGSPVRCTTGRLHFADELHPTKPSGTVA